MYSIHSFFLEHSLYENLLIFILISLILTFLSLILPKGIYNHQGWLYRERKWEDGGKFHQKYFKVKHWKDRVPELGDFLPFVFPKKHIKSFDDQVFNLYLRESCKAEFTHWAIIVTSLFFFLWASVGVAIVFLLISIVLNLPFVVIQRFNRPRIVKLMKRKLGR